MSGVGPASGRGGGSDHATIQRATQVRAGVTDPDARLERILERPPAHPVLAGLGVGQSARRSVVMASERAAFRSARALARAAGVPFVPGRSGHGWELLADPVSGRVTAIGRRLMEHATGPSAG